MHAPARLARLIITSFRFVDASWCGLSMTQVETERGEDSGVSARRSALFLFRGTGFRVHRPTLAARYGRAEVVAEPKHGWGLVGAVIRREAAMASG